MKRKMQSVRIFVYSCRVNGFLLTVNSCVCSFLYRRVPPGRRAAVRNAHLENERMIQDYYMKRKKWGYWK